MTTITLKNGYYIEIDPMNYTLRQKYTGENKVWREERGFSDARTFWKCGERN